MNRSANKPSQLVSIADEMFLSPPPPRSIEQPDLREFFRRLWRGKGLIIGTVIAITVPTAVILFHATPSYTAQTIILVESLGDTFVKLTTGTDTESPREVDLPAVQRQIEIIQSRGLAEKVVDQLRLDLNPEFNHTLRPKSLIKRFFDPKNYQWLPGFLSSAQQSPLSEKDRRTKELVRVVDALLKNLNVSQRGKSPAIAVDVTSDNPKTSALVANTLAELYILDQVTSKSETIQHANAWLSKRIASLQEKVEVSETAVEEFRRKSGLLQGSGETLVSQEISELNSQLMQASANRVTAEARLTLVKKLVNSPGGLDTVAEVLQSSIIRDLREHETEIQRKASELSQEFGEQHPTMLQHQAQKRDLQAKINIETSKIIQGLQNEMDIAGAREGALEARLSQLKQQVAESNKYDVDLRALQREADANRTLFETFLTRFKETGSHVDIDSVQASARIISRAHPPDNPSSPHYNLALALAFVGSTFTGLSLALVIELLHSGFRSSEQIEQATGVAVLGLVPQLNNSKAIEAPESYIIKEPGSMLAQSIRSLYTAIHLSKLEPPKTILITSAEPKEGKTTIAVCLAKMQALAGRKVVVVDTDFHRPSIHRIFGLPKHPGLAELLARTVSPKQVLQKDEISGIAVIPSGLSVQNPPEFWASDLFDQVLEVLAQHFDLVILDSPPLMAVSDARILSTKVDATIFVIRWAHTKKEVVGSALKKIAKGGGHLAGVALSMVNPKKHAQYGFADSGYYSNKIETY